MKNRYKIVIKNEPVDNSRKLLENIPKFQFNQETFSLKSDHSFEPGWERCLFC